MAVRKEDIRGSGYASVIREARKASGINQHQLADCLGISRNTVAGWETGHSRPDLDAVPALCGVLGISIPAFFGQQEQVSAPEAELLRSYRLLKEEDRMAMIWQIQALVSGRKAAQPGFSGKPKRKEKITGRENSPDFSSLQDQVVSIYRSDLSAAAGTGVTLEEERGERTWLRRDRWTEAADEIIVVNGKSMEPTFLDGDEVLVQHTEELREGEIGIFIADGEGYIKEFRRDGLHSHNPAYRTMRFEDGNDVRCVGRVLGKVLKTEKLTPQEEQWMEGLE